MGNKRSSSQKSGDGQHNHFWTSPALRDVFFFSNYTSGIHGIHRAFPRLAGKGTLAPAQVNPVNPAVRTRERAHDLFPGKKELVVGGVPNIGSMTRNDLQRGPLNSSTSPFSLPLVVSTHFKHRQVGFIFTAAFESQYISPNHWSCFVGYVNMSITIHYILNHHEPSISQITSRSGLSPCWASLTSVSTIAGLDIFTMVKLHGLIVVHR